MQDLFLPAEVHEMMAIDALRRMVDRQESEIGGEDGPIC